MSDIWIVDRFTGPGHGGEHGTQSNPFVGASTVDFCQIMQRYENWPDEIQVNPRGLLKTSPSFEWERYAFHPLAWRQGPRMVIDGGNECEIEIDVNSFSDDMIHDAPLRLINPYEQWYQPRAMPWSEVTPEDAWAGIPRGMAVRNLTLRGNHSKLVDRFRAKDVRLTTAGLLLAGHDASIENVKLADMGAIRSSTTRAEAFPAVVIGCNAGPDRNKIAYLDPATHIFEGGRIANTEFIEFDAASSDDLITLNMILGSTGQRIEGPYREEPDLPWIEHQRRYAEIVDPVSMLADADAYRNLVQVATLYQTLAGEVRGIRSRNAHTGYYTDFCRNRGVTIRDSNIERAHRGVALVVSDVGPGLENFGLEDFTIGPGVRVTQVPLDEHNSYHGGVFIWRPKILPNQYLRNVSIDECDLSVDGEMGQGNIAINAASVDNLTIGAKNRIDPRYGRNAIWRDGQPIAEELKKKRGCRLW